MIDKTLQAESFSTSQLTAKKIVEIFSYNSDDEEVFPYLQRYMKLVSKKLNEIEIDDEKLKRFALAGLFLTYRTFNHSGQPLETEKLSLCNSCIHKLRLVTFHDYFKTEIKGSTHYLKMINFSIFDHIFLTLRLTDISRKLYRFVIK